jgi:hypothetical protein
MLDRTPVMVSTSLFWMISIPFFLIFIMYLQFIFHKYLVLSRGMHMYTEPHGYFIGCHMP